MNVLDNITLAPVKLSDCHGKRRRKKEENLLGMVGLESKKYAMPEVLSGGQNRELPLSDALPWNRSHAV